jgi:hypothetical protein
MLVEMKSHTMSIFAIWTDSQDSRDLCIRDRPEDVTVDLYQLPGTLG